VQTRPDASTLLDAVGAFLLAEVAPQLEADKALQFRLLIAANLCAIVSGETKSFDGRLEREARGLQALVPNAAAAAQLASPGRADRLEGLRALNLDLVERLRSGALSPAERSAALEHLKSTARDTLRVTNPRFDLTEEL
jgi:Domain of unknown function (DUF6285)